MSKTYDIVLFGVTGFTGIRTIPFLTKMIKDENLNLSWAVAGRSESKIKRLLEELGKREGKYISLYITSSKFSVI